VVKSQACEKEKSKINHNSLMTQAKDLKALEKWI